MPTSRQISRRNILVLSAWMCWAVFPTEAPPVQPPLPPPPPPETDRFPEQQMIPPESLRDGQSLRDKVFIMRIIDIFERQTSTKYGKPLSNLLVSDFHVRKPFGWLAVGQYHPGAGLCLKVQAGFWGLHLPSPQFSRDYIFEGDIVLERAQALDLILRSTPSPRRRKRKADVSALLPTSDFASKRWALPINYVFHSNFPVTFQAAVKEGVALWEENTCIRFTHNAASSAKSLQFIDDNMCYSYVGSNQNGKQQIISIGDTCLRKGHVVHEIGHALGFWHEHARNDREEHVKILWSNIKIGQSHNFANKSWSVINNLGVPYDVGSVMHYSGKTFSEGDAATLKSLDPVLQNTMGQRQQLSFYDAKLANMAYCNTSCAGIQLNGTCLNDGYQDPNNCSRCKCPDGLAGEFCDSVAPSKGSCGGTISLTADTMVTIASPGYPVYFAKDLNCYWLIKSPKGTSIHLEFQEPFMQSGFCDGTFPYQQCEDFVEIRAADNLALTGGRFCCNDAIQTPVMKAPIVSNTSHALVLFQTFKEGRVGFKLSLSIASCGGCYSKSKPTQKPCSREVVRDCVQTWYVKEKMSKCAVNLYGCSTQYRVKAVHRKTRCYSEEPYCCQGYQLSSNNKICQKIQIRWHTSTNSTTTETTTTSTTPTTSFAVSPGKPNSTTSSSTSPSTISSTSTVDRSSSNTSTATSSKSVFIKVTDESDEGSPMTWSGWGQWSACSVSCGGCGTQTRSRSCNTGQSCTGKSSESQKCGLSPCGSGIAVKTCGEKRVESYGCGLFGFSTCYRTAFRYKTQTYYCCCGYTVVGDICSRDTG